MRQVDRKILGDRARRALGTWDQEYDSKLWIFLDDYHDWLRQLMASVRPVRYGLIVDKTVEASISHDNLGILVFAANKKKAKAEGTCGVVSHISYP